MPTAKPDKVAKKLMDRVMKTPADSLKKDQPVPDAPIRKRRADPYAVRVEIEKGSPTGRPAEERLHIPLSKRLNFEEMSSDEDDVLLVEMAEKVDNPNAPRPARPGPSSEFGEAQEIPDFLDSGEEDVPEAPAATNRFILDAPEALKVRPRALNAYRLGGEEGCNFLFSM